MSEELTTTALKEEEFNKKVDMKVWKRLLAYGLRQKKTADSADRVHVHSCGYRPCLPAAEQIRNRQHNHAG